MLTFYQKHYVHINLSLVLVLGLSCGLLGSAWLDTKLGGQEISSQRTVSQQFEKVNSVTTDDLDFILQRNLFSQSSRSSSASIDLGIDDDSDTNGAAKVARKASGSKRILLGTVAAGEDSLALMQSDGQFTIYHLDDELLDGGTIENIFRNHVQIKETDKSLTDVWVAEEIQVETAADDVTVNSATGGGIKQIADSHWVVPQRTAEETRENLPAELRLALLQPRITNGKTDGFIIRRLKRSSILNKLGLKRGDVILNINDIALDGPESGLQVFQQLREARQINLAVERRGEALTFTYELN